MIQEYSPSNFPFVIITGGSSGIGKEFLHSFLNIPHEGTVFNISRRKPEFSFMPKRPFEHFSCDLNSLGNLESTVQKIIERIESSSVKGPILVVNNSGFGSYGHFDQLDIAHELSMVDVNIKAVISLTHRLLPLLKKQSGALINISSVAGYVPIPNIATYAASKAFILHWGLALNAELKGTDVHVLTVCPGRTETAFFDKPAMGNRTARKSSGQKPEDVVKESFCALKKRKPVLVCGAKNKLFAFVTSKMPKALFTSVAGFVLGRKKR